VKLTRHRDGGQEPNIEQGISIYEVIFPFDIYAPIFVAGRFYFVSPWTLFSN